MLFIHNLLCFASLISHSSAQSQNTGVTRCYSDIYMICDDQRWSESTKDEYDECVKKHNGYLNNYHTPPIPDDCTGGEPCNHCNVVDLTDCECYCYDDCDGAYITGMRVLGALLTVAACIIVVIWAIQRNQKKNNPPKTKQQMDTLINTAVTVKSNDDIRFGTILEIKTDENEETLYKIKFAAESIPDEWLKSDQLEFHGNKKEEETTWKFYVGCIICLLCAIFATILYYDPLAFYPSESTKSQEEKMKDWGIVFLVFGCIGGCCFFLCLKLTFIQKKLDAEREEKGNMKGDSNQEIEMNTIETGDSQSDVKNDEQETRISVRVWIVRTVVMGICCIILLVVGSIMVG